jgi:hypothetical protein
MRPFRWNLKKREQLGTLLSGGFDRYYKTYEQELSECAAKVIARSSNKRIIFIGRSPENIFDYLSGVFQDTSHENKIDLLNISNRFREVDDIRKDLPEAYISLKLHFQDLGITPKEIISNPDGICFADLVASGGTFEQLFQFIKRWSVEEHLDTPAMVRKLRFIGITPRKKNSPNTWRWQQKADWVKTHNKLTVKNISVPHRFWDYLGNRQDKVAKTNYPERWGSDEILLPPREHRNIMALKLAYKIYHLGLTQKDYFSNILASTYEFREPWLRQLVNELRAV